MIETHHVTNGKHSGDLRCSACRRKPKEGQERGYFCACGNGIFVPLEEIVKDEKWMREHGYTRADFGEAR